MTTLYNLSNKDQAVASDGLDFLLKHFDDGLQPLWPRKVSTIERDCSQVIANSKEHVMSKFEEANWIESRINAYPAYRDGILYVPNLLFIDIDTKYFSTEQEFAQAVNVTVNNIKVELGGGSPTVNHSGNGVHILQPLDMPGPLERIPEFASFREPSQQFLRYSKHALSNGKADPSHMPSFLSCLIRIPNSYNLKCILAGKEETQVRVLQRWDGIRVRPSREFMRMFHAYMVQQMIDDKVANIEWQNKRLKSTGSFKSSNTSTRPWIEKLLQTGIGDNRKSLIAYLFAPYLITVRGLEYNDAYSKIEDWLDKCDSVRPLEPTWKSFRCRIGYSLRHSMQTNWKPLRFEKFKKQYPSLVDMLV